MKNNLTHLFLLLIPFCSVAYQVPTGLNVMSIIPRSAGESRSTVDYKVFSKQVHRQKSHVYVNKPVAVNGQCFGVYSGFAPKAELASDYVTIYVSGYAGACGNARVKYRGAAVRAALQVMRYGGLRGPCVTFDFPTDVMKQFNFGQKRDQDCLERVLLATQRAYPGKRMVLYGDCRGATTILQLFARSIRCSLGLFDSVDAMVLIAPSDSLRAVAHEVARARFGTWPLWGKMLHGFFRMVCRGYDKNTASVSRALLSIADDSMVQQVCMVGIERDKLATYANIKRMVSELERIGCDVSFYTVTNSGIAHGHHLRDQGCVTRFQQFYSRL